MIRNAKNKILLSNRLHHKNWRENTSGSAEVIFLLELITILEKKGQNTRRRRITIGIRNECAHEKTHKEIRKSNDFA